MKRIKFSPTLGHLTNFCTNFYDFFLISENSLKFANLFCWDNEFSIYDLSYCWALVCLCTTKREANLSRSCWFLANSHEGTGIVGQNSNKEDLQETRWKPQDPDWQRKTKSKKIFQLPQPRLNSNVVRTAGMLICVFGVDWWLSYRVLSWHHVTNNSQQWK